MNTSVHERFAAFWNHFWFRDASPLGIIAVRFILCANALWILLSRPDLPSIVAWPHAFWATVTPLLEVRFLMFNLPVEVETGLFVLLFVALLAAMFGLAVRASCLLAGVL